MAWLSAVFCKEASLVGVCATVGGEGVEEDGFGGSTGDGRTKSADVN